MSTPVRLAAFGLGLVAVFGAAVGVGNAVGPVGPAAPPAMDAGHGTDAEHVSAAAPDLPAGLAVSDGGYTLALGHPGAAGRRGDPGRVPARRTGRRPGDRTRREPRRGPAPDRGPPGPVGLPARAPRRREPTASGVPRSTLTPGTWRLFADFVPSADGEKRTLGADLAVPGEYVPAPLPAASRTAEVDGYTVTLDGELEPGAESELTLTVSRDGRPVTDLQPYLAAYGHLVVLRDGDLAYLHVHPAGEPGDGVTQPGPRHPVPHDRTHRRHLRACSSTSATATWSGRRRSP